MVDNFIELQQLVADYKTVSEKLSDAVWTYDHNSYLDHWELAGDDIICTCCAYSQVERETYTVRFPATYLFLSPEALVKEVRKQRDKYIAEQLEETR